MTLLRLLSAAAMMCTVAATALYAQTTSRSIWDGVYSADQAARGKAIMAQQCVSCHGPELKGTDVAPQLNGPNFFKDWSGLSLGDLEARIQGTMPADNPGSLSPQQTADVMANLLSVNGIPAGSSEIPADPALQQQIAISNQKP